MKEYWKRKNKNLKKNNYFKNILKKKLKIKIIFKNKLTHYMQEGLWIIKKCQLDNKSNKKEKNR